MKWMAAAVLGLIALAIGIVKVENELKMTRAYDRQAAAQERMATVMEAQYFPPASGDMRESSDHAQTLSAN